MQRVTGAFKERLASNVVASAQRIRAAGVPFYMALPEPVIVGLLTRAFEAAARDLEAGGTSNLVRLMAGLGAERSKQGIAVIDVLNGLNIGFQVVSDDFAALFADDLEARIAWESSRSQLAFAGAASLATEYLTAREAVVRAQAEEIAELSLRVLPLYPGVLVLPLVGRISGERAGQITQVLLAEIARHRCRFALLDLSGVATFDAEVAANLLRAARAVQLLGATPILVGLTAVAARTIAGLGGEAGAALGPLLTLADLESGLRHAMTHLGITWGPQASR
ncbi:MAG TPA: STAS domain-containing protein [Nannocystis sp.]|jgi:rsbT co-antagonist protein RsbR